MKERCKHCNKVYPIYRGRVDRHCKCDDVIMTDQSFKLADSKIEAMFLNNDFKVLDKELMPYYNNFDWVSNKSDIKAKEPDWEKWKTKSLFVSGASGSYKTGQLTAIAKKFIMETQKAVRYYQSKEIVFQRDMEYIKNVPLLIIDNFGKDPDFEQKFGTLFTLQNYRIHNYLSTIFITDETAEFNKAIESRFRMFEHIFISRGDMR